MEENGKKYFFHPDHLGSTSVVTDETAQQVKYIEYKPYGETKVEEGPKTIKRKFTGKELDDSTGLYDYGARMYEAALGRFISADTIDPNPINPQSLNRYSYCFNNPLKYTDPTGHMAALVAYAIAVFSSPDLQMDMQQMSMDAAAGDYAGVAMDAVGAAIPGLSAVAVKGAARAADRVMNAVRIFAKGEEFVHVAPKAAAGSIMKEGLKKDLSTYVIKLKDTVGKKAKDFETMLYNKELQPIKKGKFSEGAAIFKISPEAGKPKASGLTNMTDKIRQWRYSEDVPAKYIEKVKDLK